MIKYNNFNPIKMMNYDNLRPNADVTHYVTFHSNTGNLISYNKYITHKMDIYSYAKFCDPFMI